MLTDDYVALRHHAVLDGLLGGTLTHPCAQHAAPCSTWQPDSTILHDTRGYHGYRVMEDPHRLEGWFIEPGAMSLDDFVRATFTTSGRTPDGQRGDYWTHLRSWWERRNDADVLFTAYEHMKQDSRATIRAVAAFMDIPLSDELQAITLQRASLPYMQQHKDRFDDKLMRDHSIALAGISADCNSSKVRTGQVGEARQQLGKDVALEFDAIWQERITADLGFEDYASMIATLRQ